jgi:hypothetical protein
MRPRVLSSVVLFAVLVGATASAQPAGVLAPWVQAGALPDGRDGAAAAYDASRGLLVLFGGNVVDGEYNDTWTFDGHAWTLVTTATGPAASASVPMAYDPALHAAVLVDRLGNTWTFSGTTWTAQGAAPGSGNGRAMAYLPALGKLVMLNTDGTTWTFDGAAWTQADTRGTSPGARFGAAMDYDAHVGRLLLFGGNGGGDLADTWTFDGATWTQSSPATSPSAREAAAIFYDPIRAESVVVGGSLLNSPLSDAWAFDGSTWTQLGSSPSPSARRGAAGDFVQSIGRGVIFGGYLSNGNDSQETWSWDGATWRPAGGPPSFAGLTADPQSGGLFGLGTDGTSWRWDGAGWSGLPAAPLQFYGAALATDAARGRIVLLADGATLTWDGTAWSQASPTTMPPMRSVATMTWDPVRQVVVLFGGSDQFGNPLADTWTWNGSDWTDVTPATSPQARGQAGMAWDPTTSNVLLYGGTSYLGIETDTWRWDGSAWTQAAATGPAAGPASMALDGELNQPVLVDFASNVWLWTGTQWTAQPTTVALWPTVLGYSPHQLVAGGAATWASASAAAQVSVTLARAALLAGGTDSTTVTAQVTDSAAHPAPGLTVRFEPSGGQGVGAVTDHGDGSYTATLTSSANAGSFTLAARALAAVGHASFVQNDSQVSVSPSSLDFGNQAVGATSQGLAATVTVSGSAAVSFSASTLTGANFGDFAIVSDGCATAGSVLGGTCQITVSFTPAAPGARTATLQINDSVQGAPLSVALGGSGAGVTLSPPSIDFGSLVQGVASTPVTVTATNNAAVVTIGSIVFTGAAQGDFKTTADACSGAVLAGKGTCTFGVIFTPQGVGARTATLGLTSTSPDSPATMAVSGTGIALAPGGSVSPPGVSFGPTPVGGSSLAAAVTLTSSGTAPLSVTGVGLTGNQPTDFVVTSDTCSGANLAPGQTCSVSVVFSPKQVCGSSATLVFTDSAGTQGVALTGTGASPTTLGPFQPVLYCTSHAAQPAELAAGIDGNVWFDERGSSFASPAIASVNTLSGVHENSSIVSAGSAPYELTIAPDGSKAWIVAGFGVGAGLDMTDPTGAGSSYALPGNNPSAGPLTVGPDGAFWYASMYSCGASPLITRFVPGAAPVSYTPTLSFLIDALGGCAQTSIVTPGPDGTIWIGLTNAPALPILQPPGNGYIRVTTDGVFIDYTSTKSAGRLMAATLAADGNLYALVGGNGCTLERFSPSGTMTDVPLGSSLFVKSCNSLTTGPDGKLWLIGGTLTASGIVTEMVSVDPASGAANAYPAPATTYTAAGPDEGIWFNSAPSAVGRLDLGGGPARAFVSPSSLGFNFAGLGVQSPIRMVTVHSMGTAPLTIGSVSLGGADKSQFLVLGDSCTGTALAPGSSCTVGVVARPTIAASHHATLVIADNDGFAPQVVTLNEYMLPPPPLPVPSGISFPQTLVGGQSAVFTVTLENRGDRALEVQSATLGGANVADFAIVTDLCSSTSVPVGGSCTVTVRFKPTAAGHRAATLVFTDVAVPMTQTVALSGGGQASTSTGTGGCQCQSTGPFLDPIVVLPVPGTPSPNGLFNLAVTPAFGSPTEFKITDNSGALVADITVPQGSTWPALYGWGFSPDGNRFVIHYASQGSDHIQLYDLTKPSSTDLVFSVSLVMNTNGTAPSPNGSVGFSQGGEYLVAAQIQSSPPSTNQVVSLYVVPATGGTSQTPAPIVPPWTAITAPGDTDAVVGSAFWGFSPDGQSFAFVRLDANGNPTYELVSLPSGTVVQQRTFLDGTTFWLQFAPCGEVMALVATDPTFPASRVIITLYSTAAADANKQGIPNTPAADLPADDRQIEAGPSSYTVTFTGWSNVVTLGPNLTAGGACAPPTAGASGGGSNTPTATNSARFNFDPPVPLLAYEGIDYTFDFTAAGADPLTYSLSTQPTPLAWLTIDPKTGTVSGKPPAGIGSFTYGVAVSNATGNDQVGPFTVIVKTPTPPSFTVDTPPTSATAGSTYSYTFKASGTPAPTFALSGEPNWLSIDATTGAVSGPVPSSITSFSYSVVASNGASPDATAGIFVVSVNAPAPEPAASAAAFGGPGPYVPESDDSAGFFAEADAAVSLEPAAVAQNPLPPPNVMLLPNGRGEIDIPADATPAVSTFTYNEVDVPTGPLGGLTFAGLDFTFMAVDAVTGAAVTALADPPRAVLVFRARELQALHIRDASTLGLYWWSGTAWVNQLPCTGCGVDPVAGTVTVLLTQLGEYTLAAAAPPPPPLVLTPAAIGATANTQFSGAVATFPPLYAADPPAWYNATISWGDGQASPAVVSSNGSNAFTVSGTHTWSVAGSYAVSVSVRSGSVTQSVLATASVASPQTPPAFTAATPPLTATVGAPYAYTFAASGVPAPTFALGGAPSWLSIDATTGVVSGTPPTGTSSFSYSVIASNGVSPSATAGPFTVTVSAPAGQTADLAISVGGPTTAAKGATVTYTAVVRNVGPATAAKPLLVMAVGPGATVVSAAPSGGKGAGGIWSWTLPNLAAGQSVTLTISVRLSIPGTVIAAGTVGSTTKDPKLANNLAFVATTVR